jgi:hypothetical protein
MTTAHRIGDRGTPYCTEFEFPPFWGSRSSSAAAAASCTRAGHWDVLSTDSVWHWDPRHRSPEQEQAWGVVGNAKEQEQEPATGDRRERGYGGGKGEISQLTTRAAHQLAILVARAQKKKQLRAALAAIFALAA